MHPQPGTTCLNCGTALTGKFCAECGQSAATHRLTTLHLFHEVLHLVTHADKGIFPFLSDLLLRPGIMARNYAAGQRKRYFSPITFLLLVTAVSSYFIYEAGYFDAIKGNGPARDEQAGRMISHTMDFAQQHGKLLTFLFMPGLGAITWLLFRKARYSYAEHILFNMVVYAQLTLIQLLVFLPWFLLDPGRVQIGNSVFQLVFVGTLAWGARQFFGERWFPTLWKSVLTVLIFIVLFWVLILTGFLIYTKVLGGTL